LSTSPVGIADGNGIHALRFCVGIRATQSSPVGIADGNDINTLRDIGARQTIVVGIADTS
jgi:hypothetical protein